MWLDEEGLADAFELIEDFQFQIEHALDLKDRCAALFHRCRRAHAGALRVVPGRRARAPAQHARHFSGGGPGRLSPRRQDARADLVIPLRAAKASSSATAQPAAAAYIEGRLAGAATWCREVVRALKRKA